jgi:hypothetical protein
MAAPTKALAEAAAGASVHATPSTAGRWTRVALFFRCAAMSYIDRGVISTIVVPLKASLEISGTQIGLLQGLSFAALRTGRAPAPRWRAIVA